MSTLNFSEQSDGLSSFRISKQCKNMIFVLIGINIECSHDQFINRISAF